MKERIRSLIDNLKHSPGVYLMHNLEDEVIYVGKAKDLYKRVSQYFLRPQYGKVLKMREEAEYFETILTQTEQEALILEMNLIQKYLPKYNILLKDDKHYPYIAIKKCQNPYLYIARKKDKKSYNFGPFPSGKFCMTAIDLLNKLFPLRKCHHIPSSPCLYYHLGQCLGPCVNKIDEKVYQNIINDIRSFLNGNNEKYKADAKAKMLQASEDLDFERAKEYRDIYNAIEYISASQTVEMKDKLDRDIFAYSKRENYIAIAVLNYKKGILLGKKTYVLEQFLDENSFVSDMILQYYQTHDYPDEIVINNPDVIEEISSLVDARIISASKGQILDLVIKSKENAENALGEYFLTARLDENKMELLTHLGELLHIKTPYKIALFDNAHFNSDLAVSGMVLFINGEPSKSHYRKYHISKENAGDDIGSMKEVTLRYFTRLKEDNLMMPDLVLADGNDVQARAIKESMDQVGLNIPIFGLYKNDYHQTEGIITLEGEIISLENEKPLFFLLSRMQDEVHRFAITFHKSLRGKKMKSSILDDIPGLGDKRKYIITQAYPNLDLLKQASINDFAQLIPEEVAKRLYDKLHDLND